MENQGRRALTYGCCMNSTEKKGWRGGKRQLKTLWRGKIRVRLPKLFLWIELGGVVCVKQPLLVGPLKLFA